MRRVLVTGGTGFIGQALCPVLAGHGMTVAVATRHPRLAEAMAQVEARSIPGIGPRIDWSGVLRDVDTVVHLAGRAHVVDEAADEATLREYQRINVEGTLKLALDAARAGVRRFVYISSAKVMGDSTAADQAFRETDMPNPQDLYAQSKWQAEQALAAVSVETRDRVPPPEIVVLRPPLVYGPGVKANFLALLKLTARAPVLPFGRVRNRRSLIHVGNLADAIVTGITHPAAAGRTYLVRDGEDLSTAEIVRILADGMQRKVPLLPVPGALLRLGGALTGGGAAVSRLLSSFRVDDSRIREELGWSPTWNVVQALQSTAAWFAAERRGR
ncbi:MAG: NAD-dependent epimerase/dehydratase family protein [Rhodospirillales bacterium]|nr:MAG: NAD-dependent epimerase/dehydratase family protein [Rhodospirillales bacterium]